MFYARSFSILLFNSFTASEDKFLQFWVWEEEEGEEGDSHDQEGDEDGDEDIVTSLGEVKMSDGGNLGGTGKYNNLSCLHR